MIVVKAPLRITFIGDATDLPDFCHQYPGQLISTTIDKYIYVVINDTYRLNKFIVKYNITEEVDSVSELKHDRFRMAIADVGIKHGIEIGTFSDIPGNTGLGSSSTFSVALIKALEKYSGNDINEKAVAEQASRLEIDLLKEPIGKQDQYAAAYGGFNWLRFNTDDSVEIAPVDCSESAKNKLEKYSLLFYTGVTRQASSILTDQTKKIPDNFETYKRMADSVGEFKVALVAGDMKKIGWLINREWEWKKTLAPNVSNKTIDSLCSVALDAGALGGRLIGAGSGGCLLFIVEPENQEMIKQVFNERAQSLGLLNFQSIPIKFTKAGAELIFNEK
ncbi:MAG: GHMP kinase [Candidatus Magasanikbacteria bacterium]